MFVKFNAMADRRAELERKKQRLAQLKEEKERRRREKEQAQLAEVGPLVAFRWLNVFNLLQGESNQTSTTSNLRSEADQLLSQLGIPTVSGKCVMRKLCQQS